MSTTSSSPSSSSSSPKELSDYKDTRLEEEIKWHSQRAHNKSRFMYQIIVIFSGAIIPIVKHNRHRLCNLCDLLSLGRYYCHSYRHFSQKYQENWILYRTITELLKKEKYFYENAAGDYSEPDELKRKKVLVERVESIVSSETSKYFTVYQPKQKEN